MGDPEIIYRRFERADKGDWQQLILSGPHLSWLKEKGPRRTVRSALVAKDWFRDESSCWPYMQYGTVAGAKKAMERIVTRLIDRGFREVEPFRPPTVRARWFLWPDGSESSIGQIDTCVVFASRTVGLIPIVTHYRDTRRAEKELANYVKAWLASGGVETKPVRSAATRRSKPTAPRAARATRKSRTTR